MITRWRLLAAVVAASILLNAFLWLATLWWFPRANPNAILHFSATSGVDIIGEGSRISALPIAGLILLGLNSMLGIAVYRAEPRVAWVLWFTAILVQLVLLISFFVLRYANTTFPGN